MPGFLNNKLYSDTAEIGNIDISVTSDTISNNSTNNDLKVKANGAGDFKVTTPGDSDAIVVDSNGIVTQPLQSAFTAYLNSTQSNVTGDGTVYKVPFNTEVYDQNSDYNNTTYTFTAPVDGVYLIEAAVSYAATASGTRNFLQAVTSNATINMAKHGSIIDSSSAAITSGSTTTYMDAADTAYINFIVDNEGADTVDVYGTDRSTRFSITKIA